MEFRNLNQLPQVCLGSVMPLAALISICRTPLTAVVWLGTAWSVAGLAVGACAAAGTASVTAAVSHGALPNL